MFNFFSRNILDRGFSDPTVLPDSDRFDCVQCATIVDIDFDGYNEILLGTYGQVSGRRCCKNISFFAKKNTNSIFSVIFLSISGIIGIQISC